MNRIRSMPLVHSLEKFDSILQRAASCTNRSAGNSVDFRPFTADCKIRTAEAGLLTCSRFGAFPTRCQWPRVSKHFIPFGTETYSSGDCCRFARHSLFIRCRDRRCDAENLCRHKGSVFFITNRLFLKNRTRLQKNTPVGNGRGKKRRESERYFLYSPFFICS